MGRDTSMMTLYALVLVFFSLPASAWEPEAYSTSNLNCPEYGATASNEQTATAPVTPSYDYSVDMSVDYDDHTATVTAPANKPTFDYFTDDGWDFTVPDAIIGPIDDDHTGAVTSPSGKSTS